MSKEARAVPGQRVMSRLLARTSTRPSFGPSPSFYARFGFEDPWPRGMVATEADDFFTFLSAAPYYAALARMRSGRERLLSRVARMGGAQGERSPLSLPMRDGGLRRSALAAVGLSSAIWVESAEAEVEAEPEGRRGVERVRRRPLQAALDQRGGAEDDRLLGMLEEMARLGRVMPAQVAEVAEAVRHAEPGRREQVALRAVRKLRGPAAAVARAELPAVAEQAGRRPAQVARARMAPSQRKGLRPVLSSSPSLVGMVAPQPPRPRPVARLRQAQRPARPVARQQGAHREVPAAAVLREVRTQQVTGRAGPHDELAPIEAHPMADASEATRRPPTAWVAALTSSPEASATEARRGLAALEPADLPVGAAEQAALRGEQSFTPSESVRLAASPTRHLRQARLRRMSGVDGLGMAAVAPLGLEGSESEPARSGAAAAPARSTKAASPPATAKAQAARASSRPSHGLAAPRGAWRSMPASDGAANTWRSARHGRAASVASERAAARSVRAATGAAVLTQAPTRYVAPVAAQRVEDRGGPRAPALRRAQTRGAEVPRRDLRGGAMLSMAPMAHVSLTADQAADLAETGRVATAARQAAAPHKGAPRAAAALSRGVPSQGVDAAPSTSGSLRAALRARGPVGASARRLSASPIAYTRAPEMVTAEASWPDEADSVQGTPPQARPQATPADSGQKAVADQGRPTPTTRLGSDPAGVRPSRRVASAWRAANRGASPEASGRRGVLAPVPTAYLAASSEAAQPPAPSRGVATAAGTGVVRAAARAVSTLRADTRGAALLSGGATDYLQASARATVRPRLSRSPVADLLEPVSTGGVEAGAPGETRLSRAVPEASRPSATARLARRALRPDPVRDGALPLAEAQAARPLREGAVHRQVEPAAGRVADPRGNWVREPGGAVRALRGLAGGASVHAAGRAELNRAGGAERLAGTAVSARRAVAPAMPHVSASSDLKVLARLLASGEPPRREGRGLRAAAPRAGWRAPTLDADAFEWALPVDEAAEPADAPGPRRVAAAVRAVERGDRASVVLDGPRRALQARLEQAPSKSVARLARDARGAFTRSRTAAEPIVLAVPAADEAPAPTAWAERRAAVGASSGTRLPPAARTVQRALPSLPGRAESAGGRAARRAEPPRQATFAAIRQRAERRVDGGYGPATAAAPRASAYGLGSPGFSAAAGVRHATMAASDGVLLAQGPGAAEPGGAPGRPWSNTLGYLAEGGQPGRAVAGRPPVAGGRALLPGTGWGVGAEAQATPSWASRAVTGSGVSEVAAGRAERGDRPEVGARPRSGGLLTALARADRPEDVVRVILERSSGLRALSQELPAPAARLVERIVELGAGREGAAAEGGLPLAVEPEQRPLRGSNRAMHTAATVVRGSQGLGGAGARANQGMGATQVTKLAQKLMKLIHLAEVERRVDEAQRQVRMATEKVADAGGAVSGVGEDDEVNIKALQREVLEGVLRELELSQVRRQEDSDGNWW